MKIRRLFRRRALENVNKLKKVYDEAIIMNLLSGAKENNADVFIWKLIGASKHVGQVKIESIRKKRGDFCITPSEGQDSIIKDLVGSQTYTDVYIPEASILFRCNLKSTQAPKRYYLSIPDFVAQLERRKNLRLNVYESNEIKLNFSKNILSSNPGGQNFQKSCFDLSGGGFSFLVSRMESKFFNLRDKLPVVEIKSNKWNHRTSAEICQIREIEPDEFNNLIYKVWRISCRMTEINQSFKKDLEKYILERIKDELCAIND